MRERIREETRGHERAENEEVATHTVRTNCEQNTRTDYSRNTRVSHEYHLASLSCEVTSETEAREISRNVS